MLKKIIIRKAGLAEISLLLLLFFSARLATYAQEQRVPAYPLVTHSPYFSIWSNSDQLNKSTTTHWTGSPHALQGMLEVDGRWYSFMGKPEIRYRSILPASDDDDVLVKYSFEKPKADWMDPGFNDQAWALGGAPFTDDAKAKGTTWRSPDIWVRRAFEWKENSLEPYYLKLFHDDNIKVYLNGNLIYEKTGWMNQMEYLNLDKEIRQYIKNGKNTLAIHCRNTAGAAHIDFGIAQRQASAELPVKEAHQIFSRVKATQTIYRFICETVELELRFASPLLMNDIELLSRPITYISYSVRSRDNKEHAVRLWFSASSSIAVHDISQAVKAEAGQSSHIAYLKAGTIGQPVLQKKGDNVRIDWGHFYLAVPSSDGKQLISTENSPLAFSKAAYPFSLTGKQLALQTMIDFGNVGIKPVDKFIMLAYDELFAVQYFHQNLRPWWNKSGKNSIEKLLEKSADEYYSIQQRLREFDAQIFEDARRAGGEDYARLCELAYRQSISAHALVESPQGELLFLSKENYSNGSINTVDVTYPSAPLYLLYNPALLKGMLDGIFYYSASGRWTKPFPAHDLGTYPIANGQTYGEDMPVEEAGNMILLTAAICITENSGDYAKKHWPVLKKWAAYLEENGLDPANQLCTDDFAGHLARNANLSVKAITALGAFAKIAALIGEQQEAIRYESISKKLGREWMKLADAGDRYALSFDNKDSWSQKYNLIWDQLLELNIFPEEVYQKEINWYLTRQQKYGLPLDSRKTYTKSDWIIWTASMSNDDKVFAAFLQPVIRYVQETPDRVPLSDWHETTNARKMNFQARSVVGAYFMKILRDKMIKSDK